MDLDHYLENPLNNVDIVFEYCQAEKGKGTHTFITFVL